MVLLGGGRSRSSSLRLRSSTSVDKKLVATLAILTCLSFYVIFGINGVYNAVHSIKAQDNIKIFITDDTTNHETQQQTIPNSPLDPNLSDSNSHYIQSSNIIDDNSVQTVDWSQTTQNNTTVTTPTTQTAAGAVTSDTEQISEPADPTNTITDPSYQYPTMLGIGSVHTSTSTILKLLCKHYNDINCSPKCTECNEYGRKIYDKYMQSKHIVVNSKLNKNRKPWKQVKKPESPELIEKLLFPYIDAISMQTALDNIASFMPKLDELLSKYQMIGQNTNSEIYETEMNQLKESVLDLINNDIKITSFEDYAYNTSRILELFPIGKFMLFFKPKGISRDIPLRSSYYIDKTVGYYLHPHTAALFSFEFAKKHPTKFVWHVRNPVIRAWSVQQHWHTYNNPNKANAALSYWQNTLDNEPFLQLMFKLANFDEKTVSNEVLINVYTFWYYATYSKQSGNELFSSLYCYHASFWIKAFGMAVGTENIHKYFRIWQMEYILTDLTQATNLIYCWIKYNSDNIDVCNEILQQNNELQSDMTAHEAGNHKWTEKIPQNAMERWSNFYNGCNKRLDSMIQQMPNIILGEWKSYAI